MKLARELADDGEQLALTRTLIAGARLFLIGDNVHGKCLATTGLPRVDTDQVAAGREINRSRRLVADRGDDDCVNFRILRPLATAPRIDLAQGIPAPGRADLIRSIQPATYGFGGEP